MYISGLICPVYNSGLTCPVYNSTHLPNVQQLTYLPNVQQHSSAQSMTAADLHAKCTTVRSPAQGTAVGEEFVRTTVGSITAPLIHHLLQFLQSHSNHMTTKVDVPPQLFHTFLVSGIFITAQMNLPNVRIKNETSKNNNKTLHTFQNALLV